MSGNQGLNSTTNGMDAAVNYHHAVSGGADASPQSPCDRAYERLSRAQDRLNGVIDSLHTNIASVLRDVPPAEPSNVKAVDESPQSEIHGRFLAAAQRTEDLVEKVEQMLSQVTV